MAGHSKWANIQHRKGRQGRQARQGLHQADHGNHRRSQDGRRRYRCQPAASLDSVVEKARGESMPKDNIENAIKRGTGQLEGVTYEKAATKATESAARR